MNDDFKIYVDRLRGGTVENVEGEYPPAFLEMNEIETRFPEDVSINGNAYITDNNLVLQLNISTCAMVPCRICNKPIRIPIEIQGIYHIIPVDEIKGGVYNMQEMIRENVLLEVPAFVECNEGQCPQRSEIEKYLHRSSNNNDGAEDGYQPFKDL